MDNTFENKQKLLSEQIRDIEQGAGEPMQKCAQCYNAAIKTFFEVIDYVKKHPFKDRQQEIYFLKYSCPFFIGEIIYHNQLSVFLLNQQVMDSSKKFKGYCKQQKRTIQQWFDTYHKLISYHGSGLTNLDEEYVLSSLSTFQLPIDDSCIILNRDFITDYSIIIGRSIAFFRLRQCISSDSKFLKFEPFYPEVFPTREKEVEMSWTESKVAAVELINALVITKCINNGNCSIKQVISHFESCFNTKIGNHYDIFNEIKDRKNPTQFLDKIKSALIQKVSEDG